MANIIYRGTDEPQLQYFEINFDPTKGSIVSKEFKGISYAKMAALANQYGAARWAGTLRSEHGVATLRLQGTDSSGTGTTSPVSDITDKWEISVDQEKPELCENWTFKSSINGLDFSGVKISEQIFQVLRGVAQSQTKTRSAFAEALNKEPLVTIYGVPVTPAITVGEYMAGHSGSWDAATFYKFVDDYLRGADTFVRGKYVLRHTTNAPNTYSANVADYNVEKIYSIAQLLSECQDASLWIFPLPGYLSYKISTYPQPSNLPTNYQWGALKLRSSATTAANNRIEISTEYLIDAWPIHTYGTI